MDAVITNKKYPLDYFDTPGLELLESTHTYRFHGKQVPSVTQLLKDYGILTGIEYAKEEDLWRGQAVHETIRFWHKGTLNLKTLDPILEPYLNDYIKVCDGTGFKPLMWELMRYSGTYNFAGKFDIGGLFKNDNGLESVVEIKTGAPAPSHGVQLALYDIILPVLAEHRNRIGIYLKGDGKPKLILYKDVSDYPAAYSLLNIENWKRQKNIIK